MTFYWADALRGAPALVIGPSPNLHRVALFWLLRLPHVTAVATLVGAET